PREWLETFQRSLPKDQLGMVLTDSFTGSARENHGDGSSRRLHLTVERPNVLELDRHVIHSLFVGSRVQLDKELSMQELESSLNSMRCRFFSRMNSCRQKLRRSPPGGNGQQSYAGE